MGYPAVLLARVARVSRWGRVRIVTPQLSELVPPQIFALRAASFGPSAPVPAAHVAPSPMSHLTLAHPSCPNAQPNAQPNGTHPNRKRGEG